MTDEERAEVVALFRAAAADDGSVVGALVSWPRELSWEQCNTIVALHHVTYFREPYERRERVQSCLDAADLLEAGVS